MLQTEGKTVPSVD